MADKFTKTEEPAGEETDDWKDVNVEKTHQPEAQKSNLNYRRMEEDLSRLEEEIARLESDKSVLEAEMAKVKSAVEA